MPAYIFYPVAAVAVGAGLYYLVLFIKSKVK